MRVQSTSDEGIPAKGHPGKRGPGRGVRAKCSDTGVSRKGSLMWESEEEQGKAHIRGKRRYPAKHSKSPSSTHARQGVAVGE